MMISNISNSLLVKYDVSVNKTFAVNGGSRPAVAQSTDIMHVLHVHRVVLIAALSQYERVFLEV
jgi:hypothetical protein